MRAIIRMKFIFDSLLCKLISKFNTLNLVRSFLILERERERLQPLARKYNQFFLFDNLHCSPNLKDLGGFGMPGNLQNAEIDIQSLRY